MFILTVHSAVSPRLLLGKKKKKRIKQWAQIYSFCWFSAYMFLFNDNYQSIILQEHSLHLVLILRMKKNWEKTQKIFMPFYANVQIFNSNNIHTRHTQLVISYLYTWFYKSLYSRLTYCIVPVIPRVHSAADVNSFCNL